MANILKTRSTVVLSFDKQFEGFLDLAMLSLICSETLLTSLFSEVELKSLEGKTNIGGRINSDQRAQVILFQGSLL